MRNNKIIFITPKDIQQITGCRSHHTAAKEYKTVRDALGKKEHQKLTIDEYCKYHSIDKELVLTALNQ